MQLITCEKVSYVYESMLDGIRTIEVTDGHDYDIFINL